MKKKQSTPYKDALEGMCQQFAFPIVVAGIPCLTTGGLSALEEAFYLLQWKDPHPCPENKCFLCNEWATCGTNTPKNYTQNYVRVCGKHFSQIQRELEKENK